MWLVCPVCDGTFQLTETEFKKRKSYTCSYKCRGFLRSLEIRGNGHHWSLFEYDRSILDVIDTDFKAYLLGFIAAEGSVTKDRISIGINKSDIEILLNIRNQVCKEIKISNRPNNIVVLRFGSIQMADAVRYWLKIPSGCTKKSHIIRFPDIEESMKWSFVRGFFDGDGYISKPFSKSLRCSIASYSTEFILDLFEFNGVGSVYKNGREFVLYGGNAYEFLKKMYFDASISLNRKRSTFLWQDHKLGYKYNRV